MTDNAEILRKGYAAFAAGDIATLELMFHPEVVWHEPGTNPVSGVYKGWPSVVGLFVAYAERSGGTFSASLQTVLADEEQAISVAHVTGERNGRRLDQGDHLFCKIRDGKVTEARVFYHDQAEVDAFWA